MSTVTFQKIFKWLIVRKAKYTISHKISKLIVIHTCLRGSPISQPVFSDPSQTLITSFLLSYPQIYSNLVNQWATQVLKVWWMRLLKGLAWWMEEMGNSQCIAFGMVEHSTDSCGLSGNGVWRQLSGGLCKNNSTCFGCLWCLWLSLSCFGSIWLDVKIWKNAEKS